MFVSMHLTVAFQCRTAAPVQLPVAGCGVLIDGAPPGATVD